MTPKIIHLGDYIMGACIAKGHGEKTKLALNNGSVELYIPVMPKRVTLYFWLEKTGE